MNTRRCLLACTLLLASLGCKSSTDSSNPYPPCSDNGCQALQRYCDKMLPLCLASALGKDPAGTREQCVNGAAAGLKGTPTSAEQLAAWADECSAATNCVDFTRCIDGKRSPKPDAGGVDAPAFPDTGKPLPSGWELQPGDNPACVACAAEKCFAEADKCFRNPASFPECSTTGCCGDYRTCLAGCMPAGTPEYSVCVLGCDDRNPTGKSQFKSYLDCMVTNCSSCGGT